MVIELLFEPRDLWAGIFWDRGVKDALLSWHLYFGIPFLVLHVSWPVQCVNRSTRRPLKPVVLLSVGQSKSSNQL
jgi:hypothetical protein